MSFDFIIDFQKYKESNLENEALSLTLESCLLNNKLLERITDLFKQRSEVDPRGVILVSAAGNRSDRPRFKISALSLGNIENIISVAALAKGKNGLEVTSNSNTKVDIAAPGEDILTALASIEEEGTLGLRSATSMAAPHVAGVAALWAEKLMKSKRLKSSNLTACILVTANDQGLAEEIDPSDVGAGLVRAPQE